MLMGVGVCCVDGISFAGFNVNVTDLSPENISISTINTVKYNVVLRSHTSLRTLRAEGAPLSTVPELISQPGWRRRTYRSGTPGRWRSRPW